jgi:site-specific DNA-cytosine methylase
MSSDYKQPMQIIEPKVIGGIGEKKSNGGRQWYLQDRVYDNNIATSVTTGFNPYYKVEEPNERFFKQAIETLEENDCSVGDTVDAFNKRVNKSGVSPTITTRPEGFKTAILPVVEPIVCEQRKDEGLRFFKGNYIGTLRTIDACGDKRVIENFSPEIIREEPLEREGWHEYAKEVLSAQGVCRTLSTQSNNLATKVKEPCSLRIRKLTPRECWRLMGVKDEHFEKVAKNQSNSSLYHLAGDSIVVDVLYYIFRQMI